MNPSTTGNTEWQEVIEAGGGFRPMRSKELWHYRHLLKMFVWRDIVLIYQQTVLGPLWFVIQPILTTFVFSLVFGRFARLPSDGQPQILFYFSGIILWSFFNDSFLKISSVLKSNAGILNKIYFPRLILPLTTIVASLIRFFIQYIGFLVLLAYYKGTQAGGPNPNGYVLFTPVLLLILGMFSFGVGLLTSSLTIRYRDLVFLISFGVSLFMYVTPVIFPLSAVPPEYMTLAEMNPLTAPIEAFRHAYLGSGAWSWPAILYSTLVSLAMMVLGLKTFNRTERNFIDTI
jgi:lipopolysaccharide transport system permease protein